MDIFEKDEQQREEELQKWWHENAASIITGIIVALLAICATYYVREHFVAQKQANTSDFYRQVLANESEEAEKVKTVASFVDSHKDIYGQLAAMQLAKTYVAQKNYQGAYDVLVANRALGQDIVLDNIITMRAARVAIQLGKYDDAKSILNDVKEETFKYSVAEIRGDIANAQGDTAQAVNFYAEALKDPNFSNQAYLQMKHDSLLTTGGVTLAKSAPVSETKTVATPKPADNATNAADKQEEAKLAEAVKAEPLQTATEAPKTTEEGKVEPAQPAEATVTP